jgi:hypothetical protein
LDAAAEGRRAHFFVARGFVEIGTTCRCDTLFLLAVFLTGGRWTGNGILIANSSYTTVNLVSRFDRLDLTIITVS